MLLVTLLKGDSNKEGKEDEEGRSFFSLFV